MKSRGLCIDEVAYTKLSVWLRDNDTRTVSLHCADVRIVYFNKSQIDIGKLDRRETEQQIELLKKTSPEKLLNIKTLSRNMKLLLPFVSNFELKTTITFL